MDLKARVLEGPLKNSGDWKKSKEKYREDIHRSNNTDFELERFYSPPRDSELRKKDEIDEENVPGEEAWNTVDEYILDEEDGIAGLESINFSFRHRARGDNDVLQLWGEIDFIDHTGAYEIKFRY